MEASSFGFTPERNWTEEKERALIAFFSEHSCLWNHKSESYKNRQLRWKTLENLRVLLSAHPPPVPFTVEDIKNKFKNLRTTFQRQSKMVQASKGSEDVVLPQWKHYQQLMFLQGCSDQDDLPLSPPDVPENQGTNTCFVPSLPTSSSSSCVPSHTMIKCVWTDERERVLIAFFSEHSCLWNKKCDNHNNRQLRLRLLEALRSQLSDPNSVSFSVEDVKSKFKNLRTVFNREYKAVQASRASGKLYVSKWKHYQQLLFLFESCEDDGSTEELQVQEDLALGDQTPCVTLSSSSSSSTQANSTKSSKTPAHHSSTQSDVKTSSGPASQIFSCVSPDNVKLEDQTAPSTASPTSTLSPDATTCADPAKADCRLSTDSRCRWSDAKVQQLISFYSNHSCLWNHKSESYRNRLLKQSLLQTLSSLLSNSEPVPFTVEDIKTKFRNLRTIFQREHKAVSSNKICGSEDFYLPKWKHYRELMFLCESCDEDEPPEDNLFQEPRSSGLLQASPHPPQCLTTKPKAPPSPTPPDSQHSSPCSSPSPSTSSSRTDSRLSRRKRSSHRAADTNGEMLDFMRTICQSQVVSPHAGFLKYVEECLNETPPDKVKKLKMMIIETIHSVSEDGSSAPS